MIIRDFLLECEQYIKNGGILSGSSFTPVEIPAHELIDTEEASAYMDINREQFFVQQLLLLIDKSGKKDSEIYKKAGIDRRHFSKIRSDRGYAPSKKTAIAFCLALELGRAETDMLLSAAGYSLSRSSNFDLAIAFCIEKSEYNFLEINEVLNNFGFEPF